MMIKKTLLKLIIAIVICIGIHILAGLFSNLVVNKFILNKHLANFTIYEGYADFSILLAYIPISALLIFSKIKGNAFLIASVSFMVILITRIFIIDVIDHYFRFYVKTNQNGSYSFEIFKNQLARNLDELLWEFSNLGEILSFIVWIFICLLGICYLSIYCRNKLNIPIK